MLEINNLLLYSLILTFILCSCSLKREVEINIVNDFCVYTKPITITKKELNSISTETLRQIDHLNYTYDLICSNKQ